MILLITVMILEDGLKSNLFKLNDLKNIPVLNKIISKHKKN